MYGYQSPIQEQSRAAAGVSRRVIVVVTVVVALVATTVTWVATALATARPKPTAGPVSGSDPTPGLSAPPSVPIGDGKALLARIPKPPAGAHLVADDVAPAGVLDVDQLVSVMFERADARGPLVARGFATAAERRFTDRDGIGVDALYIQFATTDGARSFQLSQQAYYDGEPSIKTKFAVPAGDGRGYDAAKADSAGDFESFVVARDNNVVLFIEFYFPKPKKPVHAYEIALAKTHIAALRKA
jgi:hypothetical protein